MDLCSILIYEDGLNKNHQKQSEPETFQIVKLSVTNPQPMAASTVQLDYITICLLVDFHYWKITKVVILINSNFEYIL